MWQEVEGLSNKILQGPDTDQALLDDLMSSVRRGEPSSATLVNYKKGGERFVNQVKVRGVARLLPKRVHPPLPSPTPPAQVRRALLNAAAPPPCHQVLPVYNENEEVEQFMAMLTEVDTC